MVLYYSIVFSNYMSEFSSKLLCSPLEVNHYNLCGKFCSLQKWLKSTLYSIFNWISNEIYSTFNRGSPVQNYHKFKRKNKKFPTDWCKNDENRIRNKEVVTYLWNFTFFRKTFLDQSLWIFKWVSWWCHHLTIFYTFHLQKWQKSHISAMRM